MSLYPEAIWEQGPDYKYYDAMHAVFEVVCHSMEGWMAGARSRIHGSGPLNQASWHFSITKDGTVYQHYPLTASTWHAGSTWATTPLIGIEHEGRAGEPLTEAQVEASVRLVKWIAQWAGWKPERLKNLWEHNEVSASPTACPSNRIPWEKYTEEDEVEVRILSNQSEAVSVALDALGRLSGAIGQQEGQYVGVADGAPAGYRDVVLRVKA